MENEINKLSNLAHFIFIYLVFGSLSSLFFGYYILQAESTSIIAMLGISLIGFSGSSIAALTSSLNRYANGFEKDNGTKEPEKATGELFNKRMASWFIVRPFLGSVVAPVFIWGIDLMGSEQGNLTETISHVAFTAFMGGLLAKSILDLIKGLFKNIFRT